MGNQASKGEEEFPALYGSPQQHRLNGDCQQATEGGAVVKERQLVIQAPNSFDSQFTLISPASDLSDPSSFPFKYGLPPSNIPTPSLKARGALNHYDVPSAGHTQSRSQQSQPRMHAVKSKIGEVRKALTGCMAESAQTAKQKLEGCIPHPDKASNGDDFNKGDVIHVPRIGRPSKVATIGRNVHIHPPRGGNTNVNEGTNFETHWRDDIDRPHDGVGQLERSFDLAAFHNESNYFDRLAAGAPHTSSKLPLIKFNGEEEHPNIDDMTAEPLYDDPNQSYFCPNYSVEKQKQPGQLSRFDAAQAFPSPMAGEFHNLNSSLENRPYDEYSSVMSSSLYLDETNSMKHTSSGSMQKVGSDGAKSSSLFVLGGEGNQIISSSPHDAGTRKQKEKNMETPTSQRGLSFDQTEPSFIATMQNSENLTITQEHSFVSETEDVSFVVSTSLNKAPSENCEHPFERLPDASLDVRSSTPKRMSQTVNKTEKEHSESDIIGSQSSLQKTPDPNKGHRAVTTPETAVVLEQGTPVVDILERAMEFKRKAEQEDMASSPPASIFRESSARRATQTAVERRVSFAETDSKVEEQTKTENTKNSSLSLLPSNVQSDGDNVEEREKVLDQGFFAVDEEEEDEEADPSPEKVFKIKLPLPMKSLIESQQQSAPVHSPGLSSKGPIEGRDYRNIALSSKEESSKSQSSCQDMIMRSSAAMSPALRPSTASAIMRGLPSPSNSIMSMDSVAMSPGAPLIKDQALNNAAFLFSPSYGGCQPLLPARSKSKSARDTAFSISTFASRSRLPYRNNAKAVEIPASQSWDHGTPIRDDQDYGLAKVVSFDDVPVTRMAQRKPSKAHSLDETAKSVRFSDVDGYLKDHKPPDRTVDVVKHVVTTNEFVGIETTVSDLTDMESVRHPPASDFRVVGFESPNSTVSGTNWKVRLGENGETVTTPFIKNKGGRDKSDGNLMPSKSPLLRFNAAKTLFSGGGRKGRAPPEKLPSPKKSTQGLTKQSLVSSRIADLNTKLSVSAGKQQQQQTRTTGERDESRKQAVATSTLRRSNKSESVETVRTSINNGQTDEDARLVDRQVSSLNRIARNSYVHQDQSWDSGRDDEGSEADAFAHLRKSMNPANSTEEASDDDTAPTVIRPRHVGGYKQSRGDRGGSLLSTSTHQSVEGNSVKENTSIFSGQGMIHMSKSQSQVKPTETSRHSHVKADQLHLSPKQRTPMQARKWRTLAAAAHAKRKGTTRLQPIQNLS